MQSISNWVHEEYPHIQLFAEKGALNALQDSTFFKPFINEKVDFIITLGGDGTLLYISEMFPKEVPPVLSFHTGTLGFLMPYEIDDYKEAITQMLKGDVKYSTRTRLEVGVYKYKAENTFTHNAYQVLNEVVVGRYHPTHSLLPSMDCYINGRKLTRFQGDGLIIATPTGSTAYSLSCGGSIAHPAVDSILVTPIAPTSLSFRPLILPYYAHVELKLLPDREAYISCDGRAPTKDYITSNDKVIIKKSEYSVPIIHKVDSLYDWSKNINDLLNWNKGINRR